MSVSDGKSEQILTIAPGEIATKTIFLDEILNGRTLSGTPSVAVYRGGAVSADLAIDNEEVTADEITAGQARRAGGRVVFVNKTVAAGLAMTFDVDAADAVDGRNYLLKIVVTTSDGNLPPGWVEVQCRVPTETAEAT